MTTPRDDESEELDPAAAGSSAELPQDETEFVNRVEGEAGEAESEATVKNSSTTIASTRCAFA